MKKILVFILVAVVVSGCVVESSAVSSVVLSEKQLNSEIGDAITTTCAAAISRVVTDRIEEALPLCADRMGEFFKYHDQLWLDSDEIYYVSLDIVRLWSERQLKTYAEVYGCQNGCTIRFDNFPAAKILDILQEEMVKMGNDLRSEGYVIPIYN